MVQRCNNPNSAAYEYYGARGISVCERWQSFENFFADMGERPRQTSLDRKDNDGNYEPDNCRWATRKEQMRNTRATAQIMVGGRSVCAAEAAEIAGIHSGRIYGILAQPPQARLKPRNHGLGRHE
jgi:hypothetical protein